MRVTITTKPKFSQSTDANHFDELNEYSIVILKEVFANWVSGELTAKAIKYAQPALLLNLISNLGKCTEGLVWQIAPLEFVNCSKKESILAQNKILKKCRQVRLSLMSQGDLNAKNKYFEHFDQLFKLKQYGEEFVIGALNNLSRQEKLELLAFVPESRNGKELVKFVSRFDNTINSKLNEYRTTASPEHSLVALNKFIVRLDEYLKEPFNIGKAGVVHSVRTVLIKRLFDLIQTEREVFYLTCLDYSTAEIAKILLPLNNDQQNKIFKLFPSSLVKAINVEIKKRESQLERELRKLLKNKSEDEYEKLEAEFENTLYVQAYWSLDELWNSVKDKLKQLEEEAELEELQETSSRPYHFKELDDFSDKSITRMLQVTLEEDLEAAFFYVQDNSLDRVYNIEPALRDRHYAKFNQADMDVAIHSSLLAQDEILTYLNHIEKKRAGPNIQVTEIDSSEASEVSIAVYEKSELEDIYLTREATGEHGAEVVRQVLDRGNMKRLLFANSDTLVVMESMYSDFPNFKEVLDELYITLKISYLTNSPIEFSTPINLNGSPGIGKTEFVRTLCKRLGFEFFDISIASMAAKHDLIGGSPQFKSSSIGEIAKALLLNGSTFQPCILLDELCLAPNEHEYSIVPSLLGLFDTEQRKSVKERFLDINMNCSGILFFSTTNTYSNLSGAIQSRLTSFDIEPPTREEMVSICQSVYKGYLKEKKLGEFFKKSLPKKVTELLSNQTPRQAKKALIASIKKAFINAKVDEEIEISVADINLQALREKTSHAIGFIH